MSKLVIAIHKDGSLESLLKDRLFDTRVFGNRKIERLSEVLPTDDGQRFFVRWLKGPLTGTVSPENFNTYEDAVDYEVATVNCLRREGHRFNGENADENAEPTAITLA